MNPAETGDLLADMIREEMAKRPSEIEQRIIANRIETVIRAWIKSGQKPPDPVTPMTDREALAFESEPMEFGKYNGVPVKDVPLDYLMWVADAGRRSWRMIHAYLNSNRVKGQIEEEAPSDE